MFSKSYQLMDTYVPLLHFSGRCLGPSLHWRRLPVAKSPCPHNRQSYYNGYSTQRDSQCLPKIHHSWVTTVRAPSRILTFLHHLYKVYAPRMFRNTFQPYYNTSYVEFQIQLLFYHNPICLPVKPSATWNDFLFLSIVVLKSLGKMGFWLHFDPR